MAGDTRLVGIRLISLVSPVEASGEGRLSKVVVFVMNFVWQPSANLL